MVVSWWNIFLKKKLSFRDSCAFLLCVRALLYMLELVGLFGEAKRKFKQILNNYTHFPWTFSLSFR